jgi:hypothetical protein
VVGSRRIFEFDADALTYINAVEAADGEALEFNVKTAYNAFVVGCKSDGVWNAIKASCIMAGARTLSGALVPLVGVAPSGFNLASGEYSRASGLKGDGASLYLSSNRNNNTDSQNNNHNAVFVTEAPTIIDKNLIGIGGSTIGANSLQIRPLDGSEFGVRNRFEVVSIQSRSAGTIRFVGSSRTGSSSCVFRARETNSNITTSSQTPLAGNVEVFRTTTTNHTDARLSFYSIGESLDLALLDNRVTVLMSGIQNAIP